MPTDKQVKAAAIKAQDALLVISESGLLDGQELDELSHIRFVCAEIEDGERGGVSD